jgi:hypothetical protein
MPLFISLILSSPPWVSQSIQIVKVLMDFIHLLGGFVRIPPFSVFVFFLVVNSIFHLFRHALHSNC